MRYRPRAACPAPTSAHRGSSRSGFSLLEVLIASIILAIGVAAIAQLASVGVSRAAKAENLAIAEVVCQSRMNEFAAGALPVAMSAGEPIPELPDWFLRVNVSPIQNDQLVSVSVQAVEINPMTGAEGLNYTLTRWLPKPPSMQNTQAPLMPSMPLTNDPFATGGSPVASPDLLFPN